MNLEVNKKEGTVLVHINPKVYPLDVVYCASYVFVDKAYVLINGDPQKEIIVELKTKNKEDPEKLGSEFNNELLNYSFYKSQSQRNSAVRQAMIERALATSELSTGPKLSNQEKEILDSETADTDWIDDPDGIAIPWEEKHSKKAKG